MIYLDNSSTSFPKPESVYIKMDKQYRAFGANPGRSAHTMALKASGFLESTRQSLARFFGSSDPERVIFTMNATDALNMGFQSVLKPGDEVITTVLEHNSVLRPILHLSKKLGITVHYLKPENRAVTPDQVLNKLNDKTKIVAMTHASNVTGWIQPIANLGKVIREHSNALFLVDASQSAGMLPLSMQDMGIDLLAVTGHKGLFGPMGIGALLLSKRVQPDYYRVGGSGIHSSEEPHPEEFPFRLEAGTENLPGIIGLQAGIEFIESVGLEQIIQKERALKTKLIEGIQPIKGLRLYTEEDSTDGLGIVSFTMEGLTPVELAGLLDSEFSIALRPGLHCAPKMHRFLGTFPNGTVRASIGYFNTEQDIEALISALNAISESF